MGWKNLYRKFEAFVLPRINRIYTVQEIAEQMKPVPYENIKHLLPTEFAKKVNAIGGTCISDPKVLKERELSGLESC